MTDEMAELCAAVGLDDEWKSADGDTFEAVIDLALERAKNALRGKKRMSWSDGWHDVSKTLSIYVEDGVILRGVEDGRPVYPYKKCPDGGYDRAYGVKASKRGFQSVHFF